MLGLWGWSLSGGGEALEKMGVRNSAHQTYPVSLLRQDSPFRGYVRQSLPECGLL